MKKRLLSLALALVMVLALFPATASAKTITKRQNYAHRDSIELEVPGRSQVKLVLKSVQTDLGDFKGELVDSSGKVIVGMRNLWDFGWMYATGRDVTLFTGDLPAGTYYLKTYYWSYGGTGINDFNNSRYNGKYYELKWTYDCYHDSTSWEEVKYATCTSEGKRVKKCDDCGETVSQATVLKLEHKGEWVRTKEPTCDQKGSETMRCTSCKQDYTRSVSALGHDWSEWERVTEPNCEEEGHEARTCERCGKVDIRILKATGHSFGGWRTVEEPTCGVKGSQERVCSRCSKKETKEVAALRHSFGAWTVSVPATCQQEGTEVRSCVHGCGEEETRAVPMLKTHTYGEWEITQKGNCTTRGTKQRVCTVCGQVDKAQTDMADDHDMGEWTVKKAAACGVEGTEARTCARCGKEETRAIPALEHEYGEWTLKTPATCTAQGVESRTCALCKKEETRKTDMAEHTYGEWTVTKKGSCTASGEKQRKCTVCGRLEKQATELEDDHSFGSWRETRKPTCEELGEEVRACRLCQVEETREVPMLMHDYGVWQMTVQATCAQEGSQQHFCKNCNEREIETIPKLPHNNEEIDLGLIGDRHGYRSRCKVCGYESKAYFKGENSDQEVSVTKVDKANANAPVVIVLVVPAFGDVSANSWYQSVVTYAYNLGLMVGTSETSFNPLGNVTVAEAVTMAARARNSYEGGSNEDFAASNVWYQTYVDYALKKNIIKAGDFDDYTRVATRGEMAYIFAHALPDSGMKAINSVKTLPDVDSSTRYSKEIFKLYNAGIITGSDAKGTFRPDSPITRSEAAAIITRVTLSSERKTLELK